MNSRSTKSADWKLKSALCDNVSCRLNARIAVNKYLSLDREFFLPCLLHDLISIMASKASSGRHRRSRTVYGVFQNRGIGEINNPNTQLYQWNPPKLVVISRPESLRHPDVLKCVEPKTPKKQVTFKKEATLYLVGFETVYPVVNIPLEDDTLGFVRDQPRAHFRKNLQSITFIVDLNGKIFVKHPSTFATLRQWSQEQDSVRIEVSRTSVIKSVSTMLLIRRQV